MGGGTIGIILCIPFFHVQGQSAGMVWQGCGECAYCKRTEDCGLCPNCVVSILHHALIAKEC